MNSEVVSINKSIQQRLELIISCLKDLTPEQLNWSPPIEGANSAYVLANHTLGNVRAWVLGITCQQSIERDRPGEFSASANSIEGLIEEWQELSIEIASALSVLSSSDLDERIIPTQSLWGVGEVEQISRRDALIQVIEHASLHLGHLELTRDLIHSGK